MGVIVGVGVGACVVVGVGVGVGVGTGVVVEVCPGVGVREDVLVGGSAIEGLVLPVWVGIDSPVHATSRAATSRQAGRNGISVVTIARQVLPCLLIGLRL